MHNRKSPRLKRYNYSRNGIYFITICTKNRVNNFGEIKNGKMQLSEIGKIAHHYWIKIPNHFPFVVCDEFIVMPNHIHGILIINNVGTGQCPVPTKTTISSIIGSFKSICTKTINKSQNNIYFAWQLRFYDHIIRNEHELKQIRKYILNNPRNIKEFK